MARRETRVGRVSRVKRGNAGRRTARAVKRHAPWSVWVRLGCRTLGDVWRAATWPRRRSVMKLSEVQKNLRPVRRETETGAFI